MGVIQVLDPHLTNMIAAGEVVDRPANIVKECVENSLDAGASNITIEVFEGGIDGVIVSDDGCGMGYEDARMAFKRHATSKIHSEEELFSISTMGFRGEALPSIASVAKVNVKTSTGSEGCHLVYEYGELVTYEKASGPRGCRIEVRGLFQRTPARFKYLKKPAYEFSIITDTVNKIALAHPEVRFILKHNGRLTFQTSGKKDRREILYQMFGTKPAMDAVEFSGRTPDFSINGYAMQPSVTRASKSYIYISLNGRTIRSFPIVKAICEGYREFMPKDRYPICYLNIEADYQLIDVNVHPNKYEVRISKEEALSQLIIDTLRNLFIEEIEIPTIAPKEKAPALEQLQAELPYDHEAWPKEDFKTFQSQLHNQSFSNAWSNKKRENSLDPLFLQEDVLVKAQESLASFQQNNFSKPISQSLPASKEMPFSTAKSSLSSQPNPQSLRDGSRENIRQVSDQENAFYQGKDVNLEENTLSQEVKPAKEERENEEKNQEQVLVSSQQPLQAVPTYPTGQKPQQKSKPKKASQFFLSLRIIGQLKDSYILCESDEGLVIVDQHAAAERANFEKIQREFEKPVQVMQPLMIPLQISLSPTLMASLDQINAQTKAYGLVFKPGENGKAFLEEIPAWMSLVERDGFLNDLFSWYETNQEVNMKELRRHLIATCACHSSVRFHHSLCMEEMSQILKDLAHCEQPYHCPHGRPTLISMSSKTLEKEFERG